MDFAETVITLAPGEERIIRVVCSGDVGAGASIGGSTRKNRKNKSETRKQSGGKRGMNPFMKFASKERKNIMSSNPGMAVTEVGKELGKRWRSLSEDEKKKYSS